MEELSIEEKAKRYDEALKVAKDINSGCASYIPDGTPVIEAIFPELVESEGERINEEIISFVEQAIDAGYGIIDKERKDKWIAWLEKQSSDISLFSSEQRKYMEKYVSLDKITLIKLLAERDVNNAEIIESFEKQGNHTNFISKIQVGDKVTRNEDGVLVNLSQLNRVAKKECEIKEIIPEDATVDSNEDGLIAETIRYKNEKQDEEKPIEEVKSKEWYKELYLSLQIQAYLNTVSDELYAKGKPFYSEKRIEEVHKCMEMWVKLHNSYFFGEQNPNPVLDIEIPFGANDSELQEASYYIPEGFYAEIDDNKVVIKKGEKPTAWSEEDETKKELCIRLLKMEEENDENESIIDWLKSLKDRVQPQPQQEWGDRDEEVINLACSILYSNFNENENFDKNQMCIGEIIDKLKSLKDRYTWKPSADQLAALYCAIPYIHCLSTRACAKSLYNDLKKLMEL